MSREGEVQSQTSTTMSHADVKYLLRGTKRHKAKNLVLNKHVISTTVSMKHQPDSCTLLIHIKVCRRSQRNTFQSADIKYIFQDKNSLPLFCQNTASTETPCKGNWRVKYLFLLKCVAKRLKRLLHERNGGGLFILLRVVKTKNSHILSFPFRGLLGLAYYSALICKWAACFPAGDTGQHPRNTEEMSCQESSPATSNGPWAALRAKLVLWLKNKIPLLIVFSSNINVYIFILLVISASQ